MSVPSFIAFAIGIERITGAAVGTGPGSPPWPATCAAPGLSPAAFSTSARRTPPHTGQPMPPVSSHGVPLAEGRKADRPEPAHSSMPCIDTVLNSLASSNTEKLSSLSTRPLSVTRWALMSITGVVRLLRTNMRLFGVASKSCSCAGTLPVSGRSECHCMLFTFSPLITSFEMVLGGSVCALACRIPIAADEPAAASAARKSRRPISFLSIMVSPGDFAAEYAVGIDRIANDERQHDAGADQHEHQRARVRRRLPDGHAVHDHVREQAVGEADEGEHEDRHRAGERLAVGAAEVRPDPYSREQGSDR